ncbi:hypothetical protein [Clostridium saccharoperbutylacetonicum]|uniref:hypothetical protein n=1 Tax=Clostridium saccharoperbutylacetonicum TaxID=36745 RepID=UPI0039E7AB3B
MLLIQKRIRNLSKLSAIKDGTIIIPMIKINDDYIEILKNIGFTKQLEIGEAVLPKKIGPVTRFNADGGYILHRDRPKETYFIMREWTYKKWTGGGNTEEVTDWVDVPRKRYQRTIINPMAMELVISKDHDGNKIVSMPEIIYDECNSETIIHEINMMLEIFGQCEITDINLNSIFKPKLRKLNWAILPKGKIPWVKRKEQLNTFIKQSRGKNSVVVEKRLEAINEYKPDFVAIGNAGFSGYLVLGFENRNLYILESTQVNNATYILEDRWEEISQLSKGEILNNNFHKNRIIHTKEWFNEIKAMFNKL